MKIISESKKDTLDLGKKIAKNLKAGDIICLYGNLGAGKTVLTKGLSHSLGIKEDDVISPTFVLIRQYQGKLPIYHFDLYRLKDSQEISDLGYEEYFYGNGLSVIEWPDRLDYLLPKEFLKIELKVLSENKREIKLSAFGKRYADLLEKLNANISS